MQLQGLGEIILSADQISKLVFGNAPEKISFEIPFVKADNRIEFIDRLRIFPFRQIIPPYGHEVIGIDLGEENGRKGEKEKYLQQSNPHQR